MNSSDKEGINNQGNASNAAQLYDKFYNIIKILRSPDGCPWDIKQTPLSLLPNLIEEAYELIDAVKLDDMENAREELGDLLLLINMITYMFEQDGKFDVSDVISGISDKLIRRHPHVFHEKQDLDAQEVIKQWEDIKLTKEGKSDRKSLLDGLPRSLPPLEKSYKIQKKVGSVGFDWNSIQSVIGKIHEELDELQEAIKTGSSEETAMEIGDLLFSVANLSRFLGHDPSICLHSTNVKFEKRFKFVEEKFKREGRQMSSESMELMDRYWEESKSLPEKDSRS